MHNDIVQHVNVEDEMRESYLSYAMSVIASRALPDVRDGLKPVQRRILYAMREMGMDPSKQHRKCAGIIGEVLKSYHPHGDSSVYDALVRMAQDFTLRYPLVDGHGNFGSIFPDSPAAYRYTEARLARLALEALGDIEKETVPFVPNFDNQSTEPSVLPGKLPQLLLNGSSGIAVGMATNIPPHNLGEIADAIELLIDEPNASIEDVIEKVKGPDFPTGGSILGTEAIKEAYRTGRGSITMRGKAEIIEEKGRFRIVISEIPYQVYQSRIVEAISDAHNEKRIQGIARLDDLSNRKGMRVIVELQKSATPKVVLNQLFKHTPLQSSFGFNMLALVPVSSASSGQGSGQAQRPDGSTALEPRVLNLKELLEHFIAHRKDVVTRRTRYDLRKAEERAHLLEGYRIALDNIDRVIAIVRGSETTDEAKTKLSAEFGLSEIQAQAIVDMRLRTLVGLERKKIEDEYAELIKTIAELQDILRSERRIAQIVKSETLELKKKYGDERRTQIEFAEDEISMEQLVPNVDVVVTYTVGGYIKRVGIDTFRTQNRGGRGVTGISNLKHEDVVRNFFMTKTHDTVLFFTNKGRAYRLRGYEIPDTTRTARGTALVNLLTLPPGEHVTAVFPINEFAEGRYMVMVTAKGVIKKTSLSEFANVRRNGLNAINLDDGDELLAVDLSDGTRDIILASSAGMAVHFNEKNVRPMGRNARGVKAMTLDEGDTIVAMDVIENERKEVLLVTSLAFGKRTPIEDYRHTSRGGKGVKAFAREREDIGQVVDQIMVAPEDQLLMITSGNQVIRLKVADIRKAGRSTKGVRLQRLGEGDEVIAITNLGKQAEQVTGITGEPAEID
ncbi:MAG TPA: DNA gyrase subunit A [Candidatus Acidoferrales bacterium]|nr:DNA gyrase subunit A [Candidatus Acidoferrales bacterium]